MRNLPAYTMAEARSKSKYIIYANNMSSIEDEGMGVDYAKHLSQGCVLECWDAGDPLIGFRKWGRGWQMFCKIKPDNLDPESEAE